MPIMIRRSIFSEVYSGPSRASKMELFAKIIIGLKSLNGFAKSFFDVPQSTK